MTAVNAGVHELAGVRLPLQPYAGGHAVFMYSTAADGNVTLQLKEPDDLDRSSLAAMLARLQDDATFSISYQDTDILSDGSIDVLLGTGSNQTTDGSEPVTASFDLFDSSSGPDLTLSPQTFTNSAEAFINDNSNSLGVPADNDPVSSTEDTKKLQAEVVKLAVKRARPKATSPNRQGPQQCQVCAKIFGNASALAKHKLTHSDERKYVCNMCGKAFKRQDHLNGHMLTHRNKKPYECKAEGCGKSYCDARSLRRHTENHHSTSGTANSGNSAASSSGSAVNTSSTTMSPAQGAASGDAASPHGSSCIQYAPPPTASTTGTTTTTTTTGKSQLQQLLASEPAKGTTGGNNDGLTKQQLDLIHQIMEQTQRQSQSALKANAKQQGSKHTGNKAPQKVQRVWSNSTPGNAKGTTSNSKTGNGTSGSSGNGLGSGSNTGVNGEPKPVECNLCHRKFKNIPALNGHMRLHGGYFKKDADNKKCEKKDSSGPPLQTASVSVRALIEEKIINKRITSTNSTSNTVTTTSGEDNPRSTTAAPPLFPLSVHSSTPASSTTEDQKVTSFVVPAPPQQEKLRRHSEADAFTVPRKPSVNSAAQQEADAIADMILKREKCTIKRTVSDPGQSQSQGAQAQSQNENQIIQFQASPESFTLTYQTDEGYLSPSLQDEVFTQVPDSMLLQGVDPNQLASIQFQTDTILQDQTDQLLEEYTESSLYQSTQVKQELQAVLDSPLPESLAEFSTYHSSPTYQSHQSNQSPLPHDSPGFAYPTPPASHEGLSPCFQNSIMPMVSPKQNDFGLDDPRQPSSPLTAAFFTSTMSSAEAVEEALEEVLPGETIAADELYPSLTNSPPPTQEQSPLGLTPVASPMEPTQPRTTFTQITPQFMMPNSEDPLLSSSPKDFQTKKFEFNGVPFKVIGNGLIDLNNTNLTGILVESNGEIKFIQTGGPGLTTKNILVAGGPLLSSSTISTTQMHTPQREESKLGKMSKGYVKLLKAKEIKSEDNGHDVFLSPTAARLARKRPRMEPLQIPTHHQSRLRRLTQGNVPYTPQPILNPNRTGSGLFYYIKPKDEEYESNYDTDCTPHINIGSQYQCTLPTFTPGYNRVPQEHAPEDLLWDPGIGQCSNNEIDLYLDFACCAAVPGGGRNHEFAMHLLHMCGGNIHEAMLKLMQPTPSLPAEHPLLCYHYAESDKWSINEMEQFHAGLQKHDKDFHFIAQEIGSKSSKQCVEFYYIWKKICGDEYRKFKHFRDIKTTVKSEFDDKDDRDVKIIGVSELGPQVIQQEVRGFSCEYPDCSASFNSRAALNGHVRIHGGNTRQSPTPHTQNGCSNLENALGNGNSNSSLHQLLGGKRTQQSQHKHLPCHVDLHNGSHPPAGDDYPCKICGKVFTKIKSRSAHMKSHSEPTKKNAIQAAAAATLNSVPTSYNS